MQVDFLKFYAFFIIVIIATRLVHRSLGRFYQYKGNNERHYVENGSHIYTLLKEPVLLTI